MKRQENIPKVGLQVFGFHVAKSIYCTGQQGVYSILNKTSQRLSAGIDLDGMINHSK